MASAAITENDIHPILGILNQDTMLVFYRERLCGALSIPGSDVHDFRSSNNSDEFLRKTLAKWISLNGGEATFNNFISILKKEKFIASAERIQKAFFKSSRECRNQPIFFGVPQEINEFTGRSENMKQLHRSLQKQTKNPGVTMLTGRQQTTLISGLGGIGKTTLAIHYAWRYFKRLTFYSNVVWINSETITAIQYSLNRLVQYMGDTFIGEDILQIQPNELIQQIYIAFEGKGKTLFIFDNVDDYDSIREFLPIKKPNGTPPYVLLTSRTRTANDKVDIMELDVFTMEESIEFYTEYLKLETNVETDLAKEISRMLQHLPLTVRQSGAYIKKQKATFKTSNEDEMRKYIDAFHLNSEKLLDYEYWKQTDDKYERTTLITWQVTLTRIGGHGESGKRSIHIMNLISYLTPDNIPMKIFECLPESFFPPKLRFPNVPSKIIRNKKESRMETIQEAIALLSDYSMLIINRDKMSVHRLVQHVIRLQNTKLYFEECQINFQILEECANLVKENLNLYKYHDEPNLYIMQGESVAGHIKTTGLEETNKSFIQLIESSLTRAMAAEIRQVVKCFEQGDYESGVKLQEKSRQEWKERSSTKYEVYLVNTLEALHGFVCLEPVQQNSELVKILGQEICTCLKECCNLSRAFLTSLLDKPCQALLNHNHWNEFNEITEIIWARFSSCIESYRSRKCPVQSSGLNASDLISFDRVVRLKRSRTFPVNCTI